jgi:hypothetical protein
MDKTQTRKFHLVRNYSPGDKLGYLGYDIVNYP